MNMNKYAAVAIGVLLALTCVGAVLGQAPSGPPKPGPEHQKLAYFAGKWASEGETKPSPFGPGGKFTFTETCEWYAGGFAIVCHSEGKMPEGTMKGLSIMGYDPEEKTCLFRDEQHGGEYLLSRHGRRRHLDLGKRSQNGRETCPR